MATRPDAPKIRPDHRDRLALIYVRPSTPMQVRENTGSGARQYDLAGRARDLGWPAERVQVIDQDQGRSGASTAGRDGFQHLVAQVGLGRAGAVLSLEASRLARCCSDWYRLIEICALTDTLVVDEDGIYDPAHYSDRLLLGFLSGATYPTVIPHRRAKSRYPRAPPWRRRRPVRHRDGLLLEGGHTMARPATPRRPAVGRTGLLDRPGRRHLPAVPRPPAAPGPRPAADGPALPAAPDRPIDPPPAAGVTPDAFWALRPAADRERSGLRLSRLVLRAVRTHDTEGDG